MNITKIKSTAIVFYFSCCYIATFSQERKEQEKNANTNVLVDNPETKPTSRYTKIPKKKNVAPSVQVVDSVKNFRSPKRNYYHTSLNETRNSGNPAITDTDTSTIPSAIKENELSACMVPGKLVAGNTRLQIADNLILDISGIKENKYHPRWRYISYPSTLDFTKMTFYYPNVGNSSYKFKLSIINYDGKASIRMTLHATCECIAEIETKGNIVQLTPTPQIYRLVNFRKILNNRATGEPCRNSTNRATGGGWDGIITLSANTKGDIKMNLLLENFSMEQKNYKGKIKPSQISYRYIANNITLENEAEGIK